MSTATSPADQLPAEQPAFDAVRNGYHPDQVDSFIDRMMKRLHEAEQRLAEVGREAGHVLAEAASSPQATRLISDLMRLAADEVLQNKAAADAQVAQVLSDARAEAAEILQAARDEADRVSAGAREQSETVLNGARAEARRMTGEAAAHSAAVSEAAGKRLQLMMDQHAEGIRRMTEVHEVTGQLLKADAERGGLDEEVQRALTGAGHQALPLPEGAAAAAPEEPQDPAALPGGHDEAPAED